VLGDWAAVTDAAPATGDVETPLRRQPLQATPVVVGEGAVVGPHAWLGPGARVRAGEAVAAYAVVASAPAPRRAATSDA
jgi:acetyltransferase-like isoleucine patch superfamily enzyme